MCNKETTIDVSTVLCLACSSSLPPRSRLSTLSDNKVEIFRTSCCNRPICPACISSNPRLRRYNPCLSCLAGVGLFNVGSSSSRKESDSATVGNVNTDGGALDEDTFVLGDDEDGTEEDGETVNLKPQTSIDATADPLSFSISPVASSTSRSTLSVDRSTSSSNPSLEQLSGVDRASSKYYVKPGDTLQGIAFRFGVNGRELCRLNNLSPSTLTTTPHLLHTRSFLTLPSSALVHKNTPRSTPGEAELNKSREARRVRERAGKRLQTLTKEVDWTVAKSYVALADDPDEAALYDMKMKESGNCIKGATNLESRAIERYLDDQEWEDRERREGRWMVGKLFLTDDRSLDKRKGTIRSI